MGRNEDVGLWVPQHSATNSTTGWMPEPETRGTFRLLMSCLATLALCVYTALHLNVLPAYPRPTRSPKSAPRKQPSSAPARFFKSIAVWTGDLTDRFKKWCGVKHRPKALEAKTLQPSFFTVLIVKTKWVLLGMFAPELVVYTSWSQWRTARKLTDIVVTQLREQLPKEEQHDIEWTMTHSYFALMGGFAVETNDAGEDAYIPGSPRLHLTANAVAILAQLGHVPRISKDSILDKSKADHLAKTLVLIQAGWLVVQCIARAVDHLPLTMLELNTVAHVACAVLVYFLWWDKPLDIRSPIILTGEWKRPLTAAFWMLGKTEVVKAGRNAWTKPPELEGLLHYLPRRDDTPADSPHTLHMTNHPGSFICSKNPTHATKTITLSSGEILFPFGFGPNASSARFMKRNVSRTKLPEYYKPPVQVTIDVTVLNRWRLACQALQEHASIFDRYRQVVKTASTLCPEYMIYQYPDSKLNRGFVDAVVPNWPSRSLIPHSNDYSEYIVFALCTLVYGGIHASAWNDYFPSDNEQFMWRLSCIFVGCSGLLWAVVKVASYLLDVIPKAFGFGADSNRDMAGCMYLATRFCLVLEAFISLRDQPMAMYATPQWAQYLVHA
ncbi:hypothetical protein QBC47DRAFT_363634 [Echria macrotheca]|uniref:Uncharacterized protein n=1 Tax=Echria macrotheca TaxID=438768 RepID=A0AAJ0B5F9_9PEZI|nr:hypothetical protein QBC47DRAFT_363634 [Echria macrotheca]